MKLSTSLLFISWIPLLQLYLIHSGGKSIWVFLISIVLAIIGVWCVTKSLPGKPDIPVSMPSVVSIIVILVLSAGTAVIFLVIFHTAGSIGDGLTFLLFLISLFISMSLGIWLLEKFTKRKPIHRVLISIIVITLSLFIAFSIENRFISFLIFFFFSIMLSGIPIFSGIQELFEIDLNVFTYEAWTFSLIFSIISVGISSTALFLAWREIQEKEKPYIPVLKAILASIFLLWQLNIGFHLFYDLPFIMLAIAYQDKRPFYIKAFANFQLLASVFYVTLNLLFLGWIFLKGKFKERQPLFFPSTGLLLPLGSFALLFVLLNSARLIPYNSLFPEHSIHDLVSIPISFTTVMGPVLMIAVVQNHDYGRKVVAIALYLLCIFKLQEVNNE